MAEFNVKVFEVNVIAAVVSGTVSLPATVFNPFLLAGQTSLSLSHLVKALGVAAIRNWTRHLVNPTERRWEIAAGEWRTDVNDQIEKLSGTAYEYKLRIADANVYRKIYDSDGNVIGHIVLFAVYKKNEGDGQYVRAYGNGMVCFHVEAAMFRIFSAAERRPKAPLKKKTGRIGKK